MTSPNILPNPLAFVDLFCGIGGFRIAAEQASNAAGIQAKCVFSSDIDLDAQHAYEENFGEKPVGDIGQVESEFIPDHHVLFGGFPCQSFSIIGDRKGFDDTRGTLFFEIARILEAKRPMAFVLENVKQMVSHDKGNTLARILQTLDTLGYHVDYKVLNALDFGLPQKRERIFIVGFREPRRFYWPKGGIQMARLSEILESDVSSFYFASEKIRKSRIKRREGKKKHLEPTIWHENKAGNISSYPYSCAMRAGASYNYLLVNGVRRPTEREMLRLQGFPDSFKIACGYGATRKQVGNSVAVPCVRAVFERVLEALKSPPEVEPPMITRPHSQATFGFRIEGHDA